MTKEPTPEMQKELDRLFNMRVDAIRDLHYQFLLYPDFDERIAMANSASQDEIDSKQKSMEEFIEKIEAICRGVEVVSDVFGKTCSEYAKELEKEEN